MDKQAIESLNRKLEVLSLKIDQLESVIRSERTKMPTAMRLTDLVEMGYSRQWLMKIYRKRNQKVAWKTGNAPNCPIYFNLDELEKLRRSQCVGGRGL